MLIVFKIGGSCVTYKKEGISKVRDAFVLDFCRQIKKIKNLDKNLDVIVVHGGGSVAHSLVDKYNVKDLLKNEARTNEKTKILVAKIHLANNNLNNEIASFFLNEDINAWPIQTSAIAKVGKNKDYYFDLTTIKLAIKNGITPILHGDIVLNDNSGNSVFSGDLAACILAKELKADKLIFFTDVSGVYEWHDSDNSHGKTIKKLNINKTDIEVSDHNRDCSGGMRGKLDYIGKYCKDVNEVIVANGLRNGNVKKVLEDKKDYLGTKITFK